jgi:transketolase
MELHNNTNTKDFARNIRINILKMIHAGQSSHIGSCFSLCDIMAVLYCKIMKFNPKEPKWSKRDRFILSKGHAGAVVYSCLAETGFIPQEMLMEHYKDGSMMSGHVSHKDIPGVELSTGSLGHGLSVGAGMALSGMINQQDHHVFVVLGDGECNEGSVWEAALFAAHQNLNNLIAIIDRNRLQSIYTTEQTLGLEPFIDKWRSFGWEVFEVDGHDHLELEIVFNKATQTKDKPSCIVANTIKGKGVSFMENEVVWHYRWPRADEVKMALHELTTDK